MKEINNFAAIKLSFYDDINNYELLKEYSMPLTTKRKKFLPKRGSKLAGSPFSIKLNPHLLE